MTPLTLQQNMNIANQLIKYIAERGCQYFKNKTTAKIGQIASSPTSEVWYSDPHHPVRIELLPTPDIWLEPLLNTVLEHNQMWIVLQCIQSFLSHQATTFPERLRGYNSNEMQEIRSYAESIGFVQVKKKGCDYEIYT